MLASEQIFANEYQQVQTLLIRFQAGAEELYPQVERGLRDHLGDRLDRVFSSMATSQQSFMKRLYFHLLGESDLYERCRQASRSHLLLGQLLLDLSLKVMACLEIEERDEERRLKQQVVRCLSTDGSNGWLLEMACRDAMTALHRSHPEQYECLVLKVLLGHTYEQIHEMTGSSLQVVRTRLAKGMAFIRDRMGS